MLDDYIVFGGKTTKEFYIHVEKIPVLSSPVRRIREEIIAGRNGVLHIDEGTYEPYDQSYEIYFHDTERQSPEVAHAIRGWLFAGGLRRLEDSYDLDHYHMAVFRGPLDVENILNEYGRCVVTFRCQPEAYRMSGDWPIVLDKPTIIYNPTAENAKPWIRIHGTGAGELHVSGRTAVIKSIDQHLIIDSDLMEAYRQDGSGAPENKNGTVRIPEYPILLPGENRISWTGAGITKVELIPRWWDA